MQRCACPRPSTHQIIFKLAAITCPSSTLRSSSYTSRPFNSGPHLQSSTKRKLQTATAYRPHSLDSLPVPPTPPRNTGIPESSIASATVPEVNDTRPPPAQISTSGNARSSPSRLSWTEQTETDEETTPRPSVSEAEAQKPIPVSITPSTTIAPSKSKPSRLRSRKAVMALTPSAVTQLRNLLTGPDPKMIRVGVKNRGCSGLAYNLEYVDKAGAFDETVEQDGVKVLVDSKALFSIIGSEMDWVEDKLNERFVFRNPNISE